MDDGEKIIEQQQWCELFRSPREHDSHTTTFLLSNRQMGLTNGLVRLGFSAAGSSSATLHPPKILTTVSLSNNL